ncbi:hypothetical protein ACFU7Z_39535 [Kitasatospora sp. NPDC057518]|uniref:hypothetical protein n=1 Tax=Kitasatospora sp. NPDC057518 TaxID=3346155 RepID=UPI00369B52CE
MVGEPTGNDETSLPVEVAEVAASTPSVPQPESGPSNQMGWRLDKHFLGSGQAECHAFPVVGCLSVMRLYLLGFALWQVFHWPFFEQLSDFVNVLSYRHLP